MTNHVYLPIVVLLAGGAGFAIAPLVLAKVWAAKYSPQKSGKSKNETYECGLASSGDAWVQFKPGYYLYAIVFLIFDVEAVFLLPFAVAFGGFTAGQAIEMLVFLLVLIGGLAWAFQKNVLAWT
ncbi:MAG: NAD(P)H-quinone oxidoreductase subunit 3 [Acidobacteria bacterium]|nr:NAD(P)H-quinone oxidoreductase subunit 3 [Acidobacteriota bacterium]